jgi:enoyl-CoA hydratase
MSDRYARYSGLILDRPHDRILRIVLTNPGRLNALDERMHRELTEIWRDVDSDPEISVVLLTGAGKHYSAGSEIDTAQKVANDFDARARIWKESRDLVYNMINCSKPIVSAIRGVAVGSGLVTAMMADISVASRDAKIIDGHTRLGVVAGDHAAIIWPLLCGMAKAKYYLLLCETLSGAEAERIGLVSLAVEDAELDDTAMKIAIRLSEGAQTAIRWTKYSLNNWLRMAGPTFDASLALEILNFTGPDVREGIASLQEKRAPNFAKDSPI